MPEPGIFLRVADSLAVFWSGGVRVRIWQDEGVAKANVLGKMKGTPAANLMGLVLELKPKGDGTVHFRNLGNRNWKIQVTGSLAVDNLEQRLRNVVVNS